MDKANKPKPGRLAVVLVLLESAFTFLGLSTPILCIIYSFLK